MTWAMMFLALTLFSPAAAAPDVSGSWAVMGELAGNQGGVFSATCTFQQKDEKFDGVCKRASGDAAVSGTVTEEGVTFQYDINRQGSTLTFQFNGTLDKAGTQISGQVFLIDPDAPALDGRFTATKQK
jgi:hypothetical protein